MKQKDIALFAIVGVISAVFSILLSNYLIIPSKEKKQQAAIVEKISTEFKIPEKNDKFINTNSINPTKVIKIGEDDNTAPYKVED